MHQQHPAPNPVDARVKTLEPLSLLHETNTDAIPHPNKLSNMKMGVAWPPGI